MKEYLHTLSVYNIFIYILYIIFLNIFLYLKKKTTLNANDIPTINHYTIICLGAFIDSAVRIKGSSDQSDVRHITLSSCSPSKFRVRGSQAISVRLSQNKDSFTYASSKRFEEIYLQQIVAIKELLPFYLR